jgi:small-conductance mechanosensitive channel
LISSLFTNNSKKWRDMGKQLEVPATLFFWWLAIEISFLPTMKNHHNDGNKGTKSWESTMNKVLIAIFVGMVLNFVEKILIQLIAIGFHLRTYSDRIELNKFQIGSLAKIYKFSKEKIAMEDSEFEQKSGGASGVRTPGQFVKEAQKNTKEAFSKFGDVAGKIAGDFTGRQVTQSNHPHQVILALLSTTVGAQVLARRIYRTFAREETETVYSEDLKEAFESEEEADAAFSMFDKDMNGDISMEELEAVCVEIGRERKSITASLKDLDSVVSKLDDVFMFVVFVITILVFISLISTSAAGVLTSAGSAVLALSWLFSATAQEFLQSVIFVFVKHPFDVGDRVGIYGNTGALGRGDDYFVKEIALLYTEFKKMEGHVVQAPNSYLNTLFILNQRRSGGLAEAVPVTIKFGTTLDQIEQLRSRLLAFVTEEKREYQGKILTELREVSEAHAITLNVVFFYKSNWQNELLRLQRRNKFICALMVTIQELGIEGPRMRLPGQKESFPVYLQNLPHTATPGAGHNGNPDNPNGFRHNESQDPPFVPRENNDQHGQSPGPARYGSILRNSGTRPRGESLATMGRRVDFSLGMKDISSGDLTGDLFEDRDSKDRSRLAAIRYNSTSPRPSHETRSRTSRDTDRGNSKTTAIDDFAMPHSRLNRVNTDSSAARERSNHRNRFFGRGRKSEDEARIMETGMADIPESRQTTSTDRPYLDPRTGVISPAAIRANTDESRTPQHQASGGLPSSSHSHDPDLHMPPRSQTDTFEMRRLH